jgi:hypothetical protein
MSELREWLDSLKPGDTFYQLESYGRGFVRRLVKLTVLKRTATQIVMTDGRRYKFDTGRKIGGGYSDYLIIPPSDDVIRPILHEMRERRTIRRLQETDWREVDPSMRERICALLDEVTT